MRFNTFHSTFKSNLTNFKENLIVIDRTKTYQKIIGFGNALTGSASFNLNQLPESLQQSIYKSYFSEKIGIGFIMLRIPIGGCDFDLQPWAYNELPIDDKKLSNFTQLDLRDLEKVKQIKEMMKISENNEIKLMGVAWSPPKWMKQNNAWNGWSFLKPEFYQTWARYHLKYLKLMKEQGFDYWAISTGNEPLNGIYSSTKTMSLGWNPQNQAKFVAKNLGPMMRKYFPNVKIFTGDEQRFVFPIWFDEMYKEYPESESYIDGHAVHWYFDRFLPPEDMLKSFEKYPNKTIITTEASHGANIFEKRVPLLGSWQRGEDYILDIMENLNHYSSAWIDWNMILDEKGGPNYAQNYADASIIYDSKKPNEIYKQPMFYAMGHFSRFLVPNSIRIGFQKYSNENIYVTSFQRPDNMTVVIVYNSSFRKQKLTIFDHVKGRLNFSMPGKSVHTLLYK